MQDEHEMNGETGEADRELERALRSLTPSSTRIDPLAAAFAIAAIGMFLLSRVGQHGSYVTDLLPGMRRWLTDEYLHNGLRTAGDRILDRLIELARDT